MVEQAAPQHRSIGVLGYLLPPATMLAILGLSLLMLLTPLWTHCGDPGLGRRAAERRARPGVDGL